MHARQRRGRNHVGDDFKRIMLDQTQIGQTLFVNLLEQAADARRMHFDTNEILFRHATGNLGRGLTHAKADFENRRRGTPERLIDIQQRLCVGNQELRSEGLDRARLCNRQASCTGDEAANAMLGRIVKKRLRRSIVGCVI